MGILLAFMFLWNMLGALILIPALSYFLLPTSAVRTSDEADGHRRSRTPREQRSAAAVARRLGQLSAPGS